MTDAHQIHVPVVLETSFDKIITYQGRGMEIRRVYQEHEDVSENNKTETGVNSSEY